MDAPSGPEPPAEFMWPGGQRAALSLSFDDARPSQLDHGVPILDRHGLRGTFYVSLGNLRDRIEEWRAAAATGHEMGNHTLSHPCSGNFPFNRDNALEKWSLARMEEDIDEAQEALEDLLGRRPRTFAYPCGQTYVGRGEAVQSYVPVVARRFVVGRNAFDEMHNDPAFCDLAQVYSMDADQGQLERLIGLAEAAKRDGGWLILMMHEVRPESGRQTITTEVLDGLCRYLADPANGLWVDTVEAVGDYVRTTRGGW